MSPVPTHPVRAGWSARIKYLVEALEAAGHDVEFAYIPQGDVPGDMAGMARHWGERLHVLPGASTDAIKQRAAGTGLAGRVRHQLDYRAARARDAVMGWVGHPWDSWYTRRVHRYLTALQRERGFDAVILQYGHFSKAFRAFGAGTLRLLDTIDVYAGRMELMRQAGLTSKWSATDKEEIRHLDRADVVLAITDEDAQVFSRLSRRPVKVVGHLVPPVLASAPPGSGVEMLFVANDNRMNQQAARHLKDDILPLIRARVPGAGVLFVGDVCRTLTPAAGCTLLGGVDDLRPLYERARLVVNPMLAGTGLAIKTIEALAYGKPVVATRIGARGMMAGAGRAFLVAEGPEEFAGAVVRVIESPRLAADLAREAHRFVGEYHRETVASLLSCFRDVRPRRPPPPDKKGTIAAGWPGRRPA